MVMALEGIGVLDFTRAQFGPYATVMLGDMGAEIWKVENIEGGDLGRDVPWLYGDPPYNTYFNALNRNKKSIALNFRNPEGREIALKLSEMCDVVVHNFRPGVMEAFRLTYEDFRERNEKIIYCSGSAFGQKGPHAKRPGFDLVLQGMGGVMSVTGEPGGDPLPCGTAIGDQVGAMMIAWGIVVALMARELHGVGQEIEVSMLGAQLALQHWEMSTYMASGEDSKKAGGGHGLIPGLWGTFKTKDRCITLASVREDRWPRFCKAMGLEHIEKDPRFATDEAQMQHTEEIMAIVRGKFLERTADEWLQRLEEADVICGPILSYQEVFAHPQVQANQMVVTLPHPDGGGEIKQVGMPAHLSCTPGGVRTPGPRLGQHGREILSTAGYAEGQINAFISSGLVGTG